MHLYLSKVFLACRSCSMSVAPQDLANKEILPSVRFKLKSE